MKLNLRKDKQKYSQLRQQGDLVEGGTLQQGEEEEHLPLVASLLLQQEEAEWFPLHFHSPLLLPLV